MDVSLVRSAHLPFMGCDGVSLRIYFHIIQRVRVEERVCLIYNSARSATVMKYTNKATIINETMMVHALHANVSFRLPSLR